MGASLLSVAACGIFPGAVWGQVEADGSVSTVIDTSAAGTIIIGGGDRIGDSIFHSFSEFSVPSNGTAYFNNDLTIRNILARVSGSSESRIDGTITNNGSANLFLLNPNGIMFGPNAQIGLGGSFIATTADSFVFEDGSTFSASAPQGPSLLAINVPVGLQYGSQANPIIHQGQLQTAEGQTLGLLGGSVRLEGGTLVSGGGRMELGAVGPGSAVIVKDALSGLELDYAAVSDFQDISLTQASIIEGLDQDIQIQGRQITAADQSSISLALFADNAEGAIQINGREQIRLTDAWLSAQNSSATIASDNAIFVITPKLFLENGRGIFSTTTGSAQGLDVKIDAGEVDLQGLSTVADERFDIYSTQIGLVTEVGSSGQSGSLYVNATTLRLGDDALMGSSSFGTGGVGEIKIQVDELDISSSANSLFPSGILQTAVAVNQQPAKGDMQIQARNSFRLDGGLVGSGTAGAADSSNINIATETLQLSNGAFIDASSFGEGRAGDILIEANQMTLDQRSFVLSRSSAVGDAGDIFLKTQYLSLLGGSQIRTDLDQVGSGGNIFVQASEAVELRGFDPESGLFSGVNTTPQLGSSGQGGNITLETPRLRLIEGGAIGAATGGAGNSGDIIIRADDIEVRGTQLDERLEDVVSGVVTTVFAPASGSGGSIDIMAERLQIVDGGQVLANTLGSGDAGSVRLQVADLQVSGSKIRPGNRMLPSRIAAISETESAAGAITLQGQRIRVGDGGMVSVSSLSGGNAGNLNIEAAQIELDSGGRLSAEVSRGRQGNINMQSNLLLLRRGAQVSTNAAETATGGNITFSGGLIVAVPEENSDITANAVEGRGGNTSISTSGLVGIAFREGLTAESDITASSEFGPDGTVDIRQLPIAPDEGLANLPSGLVDPAERVAVGCPATRGSRFISTGRGGLPSTPRQGELEEFLLPAFETAAFSLNETDVNSPFSQSSVFPETRANQNDAAIVEANGWGLSETGQVRLWNESTTVAIAPVALCQSSQTGDR